MVKEMKSVDEEDSPDDEGTTSVALNLQGIQDVSSPGGDHEQNEQSFRAQIDGKKPEP